VQIKKKITNDDGFFVSTDNGNEKDTENFIDKIMNDNKLIGGKKEKKKEKIQKKIEKNLKKFFE